MNSPDTDLDHSDAPVVAPWYQRVLPASSVVLAVLALAVALVPAFRHQVELSLTRQETPYVELYFDGPAARAAPAACAAGRGSVSLRFTVESHLRTAGPIAYRVELDPRSPGAKPVRRTGEVVVRPGQAKRVVETLRLPGRNSYRAEVALPSLGQHLVVRCPGERS